LSPIPFQIHQLKSYAGTSKGGSGGFLLFSDSQTAKVLVKGDVIDKHSRRIRPTIGDF
jgi:hypothetical protein